MSNQSNNKIPTELIFNKASRYTLNIQKSGLFLQSSNKQLESEILKNIVFSSIKEHGIPRYKLKYMQELYAAIYITLMREITDLNKCAVISTAVSAKSIKV